MNKIIVLLILSIASFVLFTTCKKDNNDKNGHQNVPVLSTTEVTEITKTTAVSGGNITDDGGSTVIARGVCWSTGQNPAINDNKTSDGTGAGTFISEIKDLEPETTYYLRAYATNANGTGYGSAISFTTKKETLSWNPCPDLPTITDIDNNIYNTVLIGDQCWMKENLNTTRDAAGNNVTRYCYNNNTTYCDLYGGLYSWNTLMNGAGSSNDNPSGVQGICPTGWHVPSDSEWTQLVNYVEIQGFSNNNVTNGAGNALKSCRQINSPLGGDCNTSEHPFWSWHINRHGFDEFGFSALPGGSNTDNGSFKHIGDYGLWWSSAEHSSSNAWRRGIFSFSGYVYPGSLNKTSGFSVRCLRD